MRKDFSRPAVVGGASPAKTTGIAAVAAGSESAPEPHADRRGGWQAAAAAPVGLRGARPKPCVAAMQAWGTPGRAKKPAADAAARVDLGGRRRAASCRRARSKSRPEKIAPGANRARSKSRPEKIAPGADRARSRSRPEEIAPGGKSEQDARADEPHRCVAPAQERAASRALVTGRSSRGADPRPSEDMRVIGR